MDTGQYSIAAYAMPPISSFLLLWKLRRNVFVRFHALQSLYFIVFYLSILILFEILSAVLGFLSSYLGVGVDLIKYLFIIVALGCLLKAAYKAQNGDFWTIPIIGKWAYSKTFSGDLLVQDKAKK